MYGYNRAKSRTGLSTCHGGDTSHCNIDAHTFIHEMGHVFGLEDYYDYSNHGYKPAGGFSMQDENVGAHDPYSALALGWGGAYIPTDTALINLKPFTTSGEMIILSPSWNSYNSPFDEYILIEYYTPDGLNEFDTTYQYDGRGQGSSKPGIRLWHIDARLVYGRTTLRETTNPLISTPYGVTHMMSNTYDDGTSDTEGYLSPLGAEYADYNILQWIRNKNTTTYKSQTELSYNYLFKAGDTFTMDTYKKQFVKEGKLNSDKDLGFSFEVKSLSAESATIAINKL